MHRDGAERGLLGCGAGEVGEMTRWGVIKCPRCEELEAKLRKSALQEMSALGQASEAYQAQLAAEAKLERAVEMLRILGIADAILAGLKGESDDRVQN